MFGAEKTIQMTIQPDYKPVRIRSWAVPGAVPPLHRNRRLARPAPTRHRLEERPRV